MLTFILAWNAVTKGIDMFAHPRTIEALLHSPDQFVIPLFQRFYVWEPKDWERLWSDITEMLEPGAPREHFMGSLVCMQVDKEPGQAPQYLVIDGQQRLTTFVILLCALRDEARATHADKIAGNIQDNFLTHGYKEGLDHYRVVPRLRDRQSLFDLVDADGTDEPDDTAIRINQAYLFFRKRFQASAGDLGEESIETQGERLKRIFTVVTAQFSVVMITLQKDLNENPFAIFETLNSTGQKLEEADLIRNHVFMQVPLSQQDHFDETLWQPFEDSFQAADGYDAIKLTDFYRDYLMHDGQYIRPSEVYIAFRDQMNAQDTKPTELAHKLARYAKYYRWMHRPQTMSNAHVRTELESLSRLRLTTAFPLVMHLLNLHDEDALSTGDLSQCLRAIQSFAIRRSITGESTRPYSRFFPLAIRDIRSDSALPSLVAVLAKRGWPDDGRFLPSLATFPIYRSEQSMLRLFLLKLEEQVKHKEPVNVALLLAENKLQIEHVMPQTIGDDVDGEAWKAMLGLDWQEVQSVLLHTLGNLTLTGYNPELSNRAFTTKRDELKKSHLELNRAIAERGTWNSDTIRERGEQLAVRVAKLWPSALGFAGD